MLKYLTNCQNGFRHQQKLLHSASHTLELRKNVIIVKTCKSSLANRCVVAHCNKIVCKAMHFIVHILLLQLCSYPQNRVKNFALCMKIKLSMH